MNEQDFREYLQKVTPNKGEVEQQILIAGKFETYLGALHPAATIQSASAQNTQHFINQLIKNGENTFENLVGIARFGHFSKNEVVLVAILELLDGSEAFEGLFRKVAEVLGEEERNKLFSEFPLPPLGLASQAKAALTRSTMKRLDDCLDEVAKHEIFFDSFRDLPAESYDEDKKKYFSLNNLDAFIEWKRMQLVTQLEAIQVSDGLFFNQKITTEVVDYVRNNAEVAFGIRNGDVIYVTKIPYMAIEYLAETDSEKKRYYACHCPWARESINHPKGEVSAQFCQCSAGFHKKMWEVIFDQPLEADVLESSLKGNTRCRFAIHLPQAWKEFSISQE